MQHLFVVAVKDEKLRNPLIAEVEYKERINRHFNNIDRTVHGAACH